MPPKGFKHTPEAIANMKRACNTPESKGKRHLANLGRKLTEEHKAAIKAGLNRPETRALRSKIASNRTHTEETKEKLREIMHSPEVNAKISEGVKRKFEDPDFRERHRQASIATNTTDDYKARMSEVICRVQATDEWKQHHSEAMQSPEVRAKISSTRKRDIPLTEEHRQKIIEGASERAFARWANVSPEERALHMSHATEASLTTRISSLELQVKAMLDCLNIEYVQQHKIAWYTVDFYIPSSNLIVEVNGCYWHCCPQCGYTDHNHKWETEAKRLNFLQKKGYTVVTFWEHDIKTWNESTILPLENMVD